MPSRPERLYLFIRLQTLFRPLYPLLLSCSRSPSLTARLAAFCISTSSVVYLQPFLYRSSSPKASSECLLTMLREVRSDPEAVSPFRLSQAFSYKPFDRLRADELFLYHPAYDEFLPCFAASKFVYGEYLVGPWSLRGMPPQRGPYPRRFPEV